MAKADLYLVKDSFIGTLAGREYEFHAGEIVAGDHPAIKKWPDLFGPIEVSAAHRGVEQATAAPGELRGTAITTARFKGRGT